MDSLLAMLVFLFIPWGAKIVPSAFALWAIYRHPRLSEWYWGNPMRGAFWLASIMGAYHLALVVSVVTAFSVFALPLFPIEMCLSNLVVLDDSYRELALFLTLLLSWLVVTALWLIAFLLVNGATLKRREQDVS